MKDTPKKRILITFARSHLALQLARRLKAVGHEVYTADSMRCHVSRFSNAVTGNFRVPGPRYDPEGYINALISIVEAKKIDLLIPVYEEISYLSKVRDRFPPSCELFCPDFPLYDQLHNKWNFQCKLEELGIDTLKKSLIRSQADVDQLSFSTPFALKACYSRASQNVRKVFPHESLKDITFDPHNPWLAQEWLDGECFCTYSVCHEGEVHAHAIYPVKYAINGKNCITFESIEHPDIFNWIQHFTKKINFTGQIAFDFIVSKDKKVYAIECNPRTTSGLLLFSDEDRIDNAFFKMNTRIIYPQNDARCQIAFGMILYGWKKCALPNNNLFKFLKTFCTTRDVVFSTQDPKPFLFKPLSFASILMTTRKYGVNIIDAFLHDHEWNGEPIELYQKHTKIS
jgi:hypothetical protein